MINQNYFPTFFKGNDESRRKKEFLVRISNKMTKLAEKEKRAEEIRAKKASMPPAEGKMNN